MNKDDLIRKAYYNPSEGFVGIEKLFRKLEKFGITRKDIKNFLAKQEIYQTTIKNNKKQGSFIPQYPRQEFQVDLIYLEHKHLNKASYALCCIDIFTKRAHIELLKRKTGPVVTDAMQKCLDILGVPHMVYCDEGAEFTAKKFRDLMDKNNISLIFALNHAPFVERFNRTIKEQIYKYLQSTGTKTIINVLPKILENYNNSYHSSISMTPNEAEKNPELALKKIRKKFQIKKRSVLKVGDKVRLMIKKKGLTKGYAPKFSKKVHTIIKFSAPHFFVNDVERGYLRSHLMKIDSVESNPETPLLENTREGHLKNLAKLPVDESGVEERERLKKERDDQPISKTKGVRVKKKPKKFDQEEKPEKFLSLEELQRHPELIELLLKIDKKN